MNMDSSMNAAVDVAIIGAGPSGAVAAALLRKAGRSVLVLERQHFPRFSIGESLLPQSMAYLEEAGMLQAVVEAGFQYKNGAHFVYRDQVSAYDFRDKHSAGWGTTYQVERAVFDDLLIRCAAERGADVRFGHTVLAMKTGQAGDEPVLDVAGERPREVYGYDLLLLRPDMHVVWRGNTLPNAAALARTATGH